MNRSKSNEWSVGARSETGYVRNENQDRMSCVRASFGDVYIVSDGMGGHRAGALAAQLTVETLAENLSRISSLSSVPEAIQNAFEQANKNVYERGHSGNAETQGMGATAVVLLVSQLQAMVAHVGDSRAYLFGRGELRRLTKDHSRVQRMVDAGILADAEAASHPEASILERAIGVMPDVEVDISPWFKLNEGDRILLCSDGLHGYVSDNEIAAILGIHRLPQESVDELVKLALLKGGEDNITVQLIDRSGGNGVRWQEAAPHLAIVILAIMGLSAVSAFLATEYWPAPLKGQLDMVEQQNVSRDTELLRRVNKVDQSVESLRTQIAQLNEKIDRLDKPPLKSQGSHENFKSEPSPKSKKGKVAPASEKQVFSKSQATGKGSLPDNALSQWTMGKMESQSSEADGEKMYQSGNIGRVIAPIWKGAASLQNENGVAFWHGRFFARLANEAKVIFPGI